MTISLVVLVAFFSRRYVLWQLDRDRRHIPVLHREWLVLVVLVFSLVLSCVAISAALFYVLTYLDLIAGGLSA